MSDHGVDSDLWPLLVLGTRMCIPVQVAQDVCDLPYLSTIVRVAQWLLNSIPNVRASKETRVRLAESVLLILGNLLEIIRQAELDLTPSELQLLTRVVSTLETLYALLRNHTPQLGEELEDVELLDWLACKYTVADIISETEVEETDDDKRLGSLEEFQNRVEQTCWDLVNIASSARGPESSRQITVLDDLANDALLLQRCEHLLPSVPAHTLDRTQSRRHIIDSISSARPVYHCVLGGAGVGKTTFVRKLLRDPMLVARYAHRRFYVSCDEAYSVDDVVATLCARLGCMRRGRWRRLLPRPAILVFDGLDGLTTSARQTLALESFLSRLCRTEDLSLIVTMRGPRRPRNVPWTTPLLPPLGNLTMSQTGQLCAWKAPALSAEQANEVYGLVDGHPMAVTLLATSAAYEGFARCMARWRASGSRIQPAASLHTPPTLDDVIAFAIQSLRQTVPMPDPRLRRRQGSRTASLLALASILPEGLQHRVAEELPVFETGKPRPWSGCPPGACYDASVHGNTDYLPDLMYLRARQAKLARMGLARYEGDALCVTAAVRTHVLANRPDLDVESLALATFDLPALVRYTDWLPPGDTVARTGELLLGARRLAFHAIEQEEAVEEAIGCAIDLAYVSGMTGWRLSDFVASETVRRAVENEGNPRLHVRYLLCLSRVVRGEGDAVMRALAIAREKGMGGAEAQCHIRLVERVCEAAAAGLPDASTPRPRTSTPRPRTSTPPSRASTPRPTRPRSSTPQPRASTSSPPPPSIPDDDCTDNYLERAASLATTAAALAKADHDVQTTLHALTFLGTLRLHQHRPRLALGSFLAAAAAARRTTHVVLEARALSRVAWARFVLGNSREAARLAEEAVGQLSALGVDALEERCRLAEMFLCCGRLDEAKRAARGVLGRRNRSRRARAARAHARVVLVKVEMRRVLGTQRQGEPRGSHTAAEAMADLARAYAVCVREDNARGALVCQITGAELLAHAAQPFLTQVGEPFLGRDAHAGERQLERSRQTLLQCLEHRAAWPTVYVLLGDVVLLQVRDATLPLADPMMRASAAVEHSSAHAFVANDAPTLNDSLTLYILALDNAETLYILGLAASSLEGDMRGVCGALRRLGEVCLMRARVNLEREGVDLGRMEIGMHLGRAQAQVDVAGSRSSTGGASSNTGHTPSPFYTPTSHSSLQQPHHSTSDSSLPIFTAASSLATSTSLIHAALTGFEWAGVEHERGRAMLGVGDVVWATGACQDRTADKPGVNRGKSMLEAKRWWSRAREVFAGCGMSGGVVACRERLERLESSGQRFWERKG